MEYHIISYYIYSPIKETHSTHMNDKFCEPLHSLSINFMPFHWEVIIPYHSSLGPPSDATVMEGETIQSSSEPRSRHGKKP